MKDHEIAHLVNELRGIATTYTNAEQLRSRISECVNNALRNSAPEAPRQAEPVAFVHDCGWMEWKDMKGFKPGDKLYLHPAPLSPDHSGGGAGVVLPDNLITHRYSWIRAMERLLEVDEDDKGFWLHELQAMRDMYADLDKIKELNQ